MLEKTRGALSLILPLAVFAHQAVDIGAYSISLKVCLILERTALLFRLVHLFPPSACRLQSEAEVKTVRLHADTIAHGRHVYQLKDKHCGIEYNLEKKASHAPVKRAFVWNEKEECVGEEKGERSLAAPAQERPGGVAEIGPSNACRFYLVMDECSIEPYGFSHCSKPFSRLFLAAIWQSPTTKMPAKEPKKRPIVKANHAISAPFGFLRLSFFLVYLIRISKALRRTL